MKYFKVKLNTQEIVVNDNSQSMFKSIDYMNKNYITKSKKNAFVMIIALLKPNQFTSTLEKKLL